MKRVGRPDAIDLIGDTREAWATPLMLAAPELGKAARATALAVVQKYATAGTGTPIAALAGIAADRAATAWLGLGPIANGGFGIAGGNIVLRVIGAAPIVASGAVILGTAIRSEVRAAQPSESERVSTEAVE